jgi:hypothetical protein
MNIDEPRPAENSPRIWLSIISALAACAGSLWLSLGMDLKACPLCLYQRACIFCAATVLILATMLRKQDPATIGSLALAPAVAGLAVGIYHVVLESAGTLECPRGIGGIGSAPQQAVVAEILVVAVLVLAALPRWSGVLLATGLGIAVGSMLIRSAPPLPPKPEKPYTAPLDICRPRYVAS